MEELNLNHKKKKLTRVFSDAFPPNILGKKDKNPSYSSVHKDLSNIELDLSRIIYREMKPYDKDTIMMLHKEWFPIEYTEEYFDKIFSPQDGKVYISLLATYFYIDRELILGAIIAEINRTHEFVNQLPVEYYNNIDIPFFDRINIFGDPLEFGYIMIIGVVDECRKLKLGSILLEKITLQFMKRHSCHAIYLHVVHYNQIAINFYKRNNFLNVTTLKNFYHIKNNSYDCEVFVKFFSSKNKYIVSEQKVFNRLIKVFLLNPFNFLIYLLTLGFLLSCCRKNKLD